MLAESGAACVVRKKRVQVGRKMSAPRRRQLSQVTDQPESVQGAAGGGCCEQPSMVPEECRRYACPVRLLAQNSCPACRWCRSSRRQRACRRRQWTGLGGPVRLGQHMRRERRWWWKAAGFTQPQAKYSSSECSRQHVIEWGAGVRGRRRCAWCNVLVETAACRRVRTSPVMSFLPQRVTRQRRRWR